MLNKGQKPYSILFVEDEQEIRDNYTRYLRRHFEAVYEAVDGEMGYKLYKEHKPNIMILDINIPKLNGLELLKKVRQTDQSTKVILLTAYSDKKYLLDAVELKLVKYLVKPIARAELKEALDMAIKEFNSFDIVSRDILELKDGYRWDCNSKVLFFNDEEVSLTKKEKQIVLLLLSNPNIVFSYEDIISKIWEFTDEDKINPLKTLIKNIRKKLPQNTIKNVFGIGYKF